MPTYDRLRRFYEIDYPRTLFPLATNLILVQRASEQLARHVYETIFDKSDDAFLMQSRVHASKPGMHVRRTLKLDPIAEFYLYDVVYRNRASFRRNYSNGRKNYGYRFVNGELISPSASYRQFRAAISSASEEYAFFVKFDIATYFNSIYHHDLFEWFSEEDSRLADADGIGLFFRQINAGRSVDCLPHGLAPCKIIGSQFLRFVDNSNRVRSELLLRFMDDFYLFSDDLEKITGDFELIQRLLGDKGLSVNSAKTSLGPIELLLESLSDVDTIRLSLLRMRSQAIEASGADADDDDNGVIDLNDEQKEYLYDLLRNPEIEEDDAELVLSIMRDESSDVLQYIEPFIVRFPNLARNIHRFCAFVEDKEELSQTIHSLLETKEYLTEYQLFWIAKTVEDYLLATDPVGEILGQLFEHPNSSAIPKAKVLEIPESRFGMRDLREEQLRTGKSDWLAWAAAMGSREMPRARRNHLLGYFSNGSSMNRLISDCVKSL